jgi:hypothetical protein
MRVSSDRPLVAGCVGSREIPNQMIDREKVIAILRKRFPGSPPDEVAAAANAIVGLRGEWREVENFEGQVECHLGACKCDDPNWFISQIVQGRRFKLFEHVD